MKAAELNPATKALIVLPVASLLATLILIAVQLVFGRLLQSPALATWPPAAQESVFTLTAFGLLAAAAITGLWLFEGAALIGRGRPLDFPTGAALGIAGLWLSVELSAIAGVSGTGTAQAGSKLLLLAGTALTLFQTGVEELYFRGWIQPALQAGWGRWPGLIATALAFAGLHFVSGEFEPVSLLNLFLGGLWFGLLAERSGGLLLPVGAHFGWNWAEEMLFGVTPNPGSGNFGALFDWELVGAKLWGGSSDGLNASLSATFVLIAFVVATLGWRGRVSSPAPRG